jgi:uncharacterized protein YbjQ (UPF0145 family)
MNNKIIITTTNSIENSEIVRYIDLISTNSVIGANFFSDFSASITDFFGGFSDSYQNKLQAIYKVAIDNLKFKAANLGANAIIGLKIDFDEISGKGKSMFMISAIGTAVVINYKKEGVNNFKENTVSLVSNDKLEAEVTKRNIISNLERKVLPNQEDWIYLFNNPIESISGQILDQYLYLVSSNSGIENEVLLVSNTINYFKLLDTEIALTVLYAKVTEKPQLIINILKINKLFSPLLIFNFVKDGQINLAIDCLSIDKEFYTKSDLGMMQDIVNALEHLPAKGRIEMVKGMLSKSKEKYICPNGHTNDAEDEFCSNLSCELNTKGLVKLQVRAIERFKLKVDSLFSLINEKSDN